MKITITIFTFFVLFGINGSFVDACSKSSNMMDMSCKTNGELCCYTSKPSNKGRHTNFGKVMGNSGYHNGHFDVKLYPVSESPII